MSSTTASRQERHVGNIYIRKLRRISPASWWSSDSPKLPVSYKAVGAQTDGQLESVLEKAPSTNEGRSSTCISIMSSLQAPQSTQPSTQNDNGDKPQRRDSKNWPLPSEADCSIPSSRAMTPDQDSQRPLRRSIAGLFKRRSWTPTNGHDKVPQAQPSWSTVLSDATTVRHEETWYDDQDSDEEQPDHEPPIPQPQRSRSQMSNQRRSNLPSHPQPINPLSQHPPQLSSARLPAIPFPSISHSLQSPEVHHSHTNTCPAPPNRKASINKLSSTASTVKKSPPSPSPSPADASRPQPSSGSESSQTPSPSAARPQTVLHPRALTPSTPPTCPLQPRLHDLESLLADLLRRFADNTTQTRTHHTLLSELSLSSSATLTSLATLTSHLDSLQSQNETLVSQLEALKVIVEGLGIKVGGLGMQVEAVAEVAREGEFGVWEVEEKGRRVEGRVGRLEERIWVLEHEKGDGREDEKDDKKGDEKGDKKGKGNGRKDDTVPETGME